MGKSILLVEHDAVELARLGSVLEAAGYEVWRASDAESAAARIERQRPGAIVLATGLPGMSHAQLLWQVRDRERMAQDGSSLPVFIISEKAGKEDRAKALKLGATDYVIKPFVDDELLVRLERVVPAGPAGASSDRAPAASGGQAPAHGGGKADGQRTVLVAEDVTVLRRMIAVAVESLGCRVIQAADGAEALSLVNERLDLVIMDVLMPGLDGIEILRRIRADEKTRDLPVILCTTRAHTSQVTAAARLGIAGYIVKPFKPGTLIEKVSAVLGTEP